MTAAMAELAAAQTNEGGGISVVEEEEDVGGGVNEMMQKIKDPGMFDSSTIAHISRQPSAHKSWRNAFNSRRRHCTAPPRSRSSQRFRDD